MMSSLRDLRPVGGTKTATLPPNNPAGGLVNPFTPTSAFGTNYYDSAPGPPGPYSYGNPYTPMSATGGGPASTPQYFGGRRQSQSMAYASGNTNVGGYAPSTYYSNAYPASQIGGPRAPPTYYGGNYYSRNNAYETPPPMPGVEDEHQFPNYLTEQLGDFKLQSTDSGGFRDLFLQECSSQVAKRGREFAEFNVHALQLEEAVRFRSPTPATTAWFQPLQGKPPRFLLLIAE
jgi:hypothetical protein